MRSIIEKFIVLVFCFYNSYINNQEIDLVLLFLFSLIFSIVLDLLHDKKYRYIVYMTFILLTFINPNFLTYLPLILYNTYKDFKEYTPIFFPLLLINPNPLNIILSIFSLYLSYNTNLYNTLLVTNKETRDSLVENTLYLEKYNKQLKIDKAKNIHIAILTERNRIARQLHDSIGHSLSSGILQVEALKFSCNEGSRESLNTLQDTLKNGMEDIRRSIHNLYKESMDLENKIHELGHDFPDLDLNLNYKFYSELDCELNFDILTIVSESITNCAKHSNASKIRIALIEQNKFYSITISDNGSNFNMDENIQAKGIGLSTMREIAYKYKGLFNYKFENGFKIHITLMKG